jgi:hypothetical protein
MNNLLITFGSWEDRFRLGYKRLIEKHNISKVIVFYFDEYYERSKENVKAAKHIKNCDLVPLSISKPAESFSCIIQTLGKCDTSNVIFDITTATRDVIWIVLNFIEHTSKNLICVYHQPAGYGDWLSHNPGKPRIVYKLGGELELGWPTKLLVLSGYDIERVRQLIDTFEPDETLLGCHNGKDYKNKERRVTKEALNSSDPSVRDFEFDAYSKDFGYNSININAAPLFQNSNVVIASLGPKISSIPLYMLHKQHSNSALVYTPSNEYSPNYSHGIGETHIVNLK